MCAGHVAAKGKGLSPLEVMSMSLSQRAEVLPGALSVEEVCCSSGSLGMGESVLSGICWAEHPRTPWGPRL